MVTSGNQTVKNPHEKSMTFPFKTVEKNMLWVIFQPAAFDYIEFFKHF
jgi:hypothetical protein